MSTSVSLDKIVDLTVELSNPTFISSNFSLGLIIGNSNVLTAQNRVKVYAAETFKQQMVTDGFTTDSPEYLAAVAYFNQSPTPATLAVGVQLAANGDVAAETAVQAFNACRAVNEEFYGFAFTAALEKADILAVASEIQSDNSHVVFFCQTNDNNCLQPGTENVMASLQSANYERVCCMYATQSYECIGVLGLFSGMNSLEPNSAYTMAYKTLIGFNPEQIGTAGMSALEGYNGNTFCKFGGRYNFLYPMIVSSGLHLDEVFTVDASHFLIQQNVVAGIASRRKISQTDDGMGEIGSFITTGCEVLAAAGFIATGIWNGPKIMDLNTGDAIIGGYLIQYGSLADQSAADRAKRITPPIYVCLKLSGAIEHVMIRVFINQ